MLHILSLFYHHHHHHHFVFRLLLIIVHTKARVRRYQQLNPSKMSYLVHLSSLVRAFSCHPSHTSSMSSYSPPSLHHLPPLYVCACGHACVCVCMCVHAFVCMLACVCDSEC